MKAKSMLEMAYICGLKTIEEAHLNIVRHSMSLYKYTEIQYEERELIVDMAILGMLEDNEDNTISIKDALVSDFLTQEERNKVDQDMEAYFQRND